jgi:lipopolysaccharide transport system ATP-binding protein
VSAPTIRVSGLSKRFRIGERVRYKSLRESIQNAVAAPFRRGRRPKETIWALRDVSFEVAPGEVVGVIGRNGAGKSTLLKVLSRITEPTEGRVELRGRVGSLLEVGTGFHLELTGRENIYLSGAILGMKRAEIVQRFDEIVAFAEVERFLDTPVKHYSTGMYLRLAFAVAAHLEPEILLVDEVLAVGDSEFQKKCLGKMGDVARAGRTVLFVSHNLGAVAGLCSRALCFEDGRLLNDGSAAEVVTAYLRRSSESETSSIAQFRSPGMGREVGFTSVRLVSEDGRSALYGEPLVFQFEVESRDGIGQLTLAASLFNSLGTCVGTLFDRQVFDAPAGRCLALRLKVPSLNLAPGLYTAGFSLGRGDERGTRFDYDGVVGIPAFEVLAVGKEANVSTWNPSWGNIVILGTELSVAVEEVR